MIWLYWRRVRVTVLVTCLSTAALAGLVIMVAFVVGSGPGLRPGPGIGSQATIAGFQRGSLPAGDAAAGHRGVQLMTAAVVACQTVSYNGVQMVAWWSRDGASSYLIQVSHRRGTPVYADGDDGGDVGSGAGKQAGGGSASTAGTHVVAGVLTLSPWMLALMRSNYVIEYAGAGTASGRAALIVTLRRRGGGLAAQYWLDQATSLPLRRQVFDRAGHLVNEGVFVDLKIGNGTVGAAPVPGQQAWSSSPSTAAIASLRRQGWYLPTGLGSDLALVAVTTSRTSSGVVVDASYSDGLSVVSVFMQRGELPDKLSGWHQTYVRGVTVYSSEPDQRSLAWSAQGVVYTVIADAPPETVDDVVAGLPHDQSPGFWQRVSNGLGRMGSWFDPFS
jgi:hypothetical protein